jgi:hypothetical protein
MLKRPLINTISTYFVIKPYQLAVVDKLSHGHHIAYSNYQLTMDLGVSACSPKETEDATVHVFFRYSHRIYLVNGDTKYRKSR